MKKTLLPMLAVMVALSSAAATPLRLARMPKAEPKPTEAVRFYSPANGLTETAPGPWKAAGTIQYTLAGEPYTSLGFNNTSKGVQMATAFEITPEVSTKFAGARIVSVSFYSAVNSSTNRNDITLYNVWVSEGDLITGPVTEGTEIEPVSKKGTFAGTTAQAYYTVNLDTPVTIEAGKHYFVGTYFTIASPNDYPAMIDYEPTDNLAGGWFAMRADGNSAWQWDNFASDYGNNCLACGIQGDNMPENEAAPSDMEVDLSAKAGQPFEFAFEVKNKACNNITNIEYTYQVGTEAPVTLTEQLQSAISYDKTEVVYVSNAVASTAGREPTPVTVTINKINGQANNLTPEESTMTGYIDIVPADKGFERRMVIEEGTSIWCGWCPFGIGAFEYVREKYKNGEVIPVAVHSPFSGNSDPMTSPTYYEFVKRYISAFPSAMLNRYYEVQLGTTEIGRYFDLYYEVMSKWPSLVDLKMDVRWADTRETTLQFDAKTTYIWDYDQAPGYLLSFALKEDKVGPYNQQNYLNGQYNFYGWGSRGSVVSWTFDDVARQIEGFDGIEGSIPSNIEAGKEYKYSYIAPLGDQISNAENLTAICYLINAKTGIIENAISVPASEFLTYDPSGIKEAVSDDADAPVEYFNLQGIRVDNPQGGIFIRRQGGTVTKVVR